MRLSVIASVGNDVEFSSRLRCEPPIVKGGSRRTSVLNGLMYLRHRIRYSGPSF